MAAVHVGVLKDPPSPASDFLETKNTIRRSSSSGVHWHFVPGSVSFLAALELELAAFRPRWIVEGVALVGASPGALLGTGSQAAGR